MNELVDITNYKDLKACDPADVVKRTGCEFEKADNRYRITVWGHEYAVDLEAFRIYPMGDGSPEYHGFMDLFILYYLMKSKDLPLSGEWVSEKDIQGGAAFFRGPHTIPTDGMTRRFGDDLEKFAKACEKAGGIPLDMADAAFILPVTPATPVAVLYWQGDEDFPSEAKLLFDRTIQEHLPLDIIFALAVEVCQRMVKS